MPLLRNERTDAHDPWVRLDDDAPLPDGDGDTSTPVVLGLARFLAESARGADVRGVLIAPDDDPRELAPHVARLCRVAIDFPAYTDGRGYSHARVLREHLDYDGEIRAVGDVRIDQIAFMMRAGIDAFELADALDEGTLRTALTRYRTNYQPSYPLPTAAG